MISLIIPMYNSEQTIEQTLESVVEQTVQFAEVIVVDNGSSDRSVTIAETFCNYHSFIRLVHCERRGVSAARNMGIEVATSEYIGFLDADDILEDNYVESLQSFILQNPNADMYHFNFYHQFKNGIIKENPYFLHDQLSYSGYEFMEKTLRNFSFEAKHMVWTFLFRKHFLDINGLRFISEVGIFEDILFLHEVWKWNPKILIVEKVLLSYCYVENSITNKTISQDSLEPLLNFVQEMAKEASAYKTKYYFELLSRICSFQEYNWLLKKVYHRSFLNNLWSYISNKITYMYMKIKK